MSLENRLSEAFSLRHKLNFVETRIYNLTYLIQASLLCPFHITSFSNFSVFVDIQHPFTLLRFCTKMVIKIPVLCIHTIDKSGVKISIYAAYDLSHCSDLVKRHNGVEAVTLISPEQLIAANSLNRNGEKNVHFCETVHTTSHKMYVFENVLDSGYYETGVIENVADQCKHIKTDINKNTATTTTKSYSLLAK